MIGGYKVIYTRKSGERRERVEEFYPCLYGRLDADEAQNAARARAAELRASDVAACVEPYNVR